MAHLNFTLIILFRGLGPKAGLIKKIDRETVVVVVFTCPWFKYSLWQKILMNFLLLTVEKTKIKKNEAGNGLFKNPSCSGFEPSDWFKKFEQPIRIAKI